MAALILVGLNVLDAWLVGIYLGVEAVELNPLAPTLMGNMVARGLMATAIILTLYLVRKETLLWWANLVIFGVASWHLGVLMISPLTNPLS
ncbi:hypothetical protein ACFLU8_01410 [Chloroflexota bacterium]